MPGDGIEFRGHLFVAGPDGQIIAQAPADQDHILLAHQDLREVEITRIGWPFLRDRPINAYGNLMRRFVDQG